MLHRIKELIAFLLNPPGHRLDEISSIKREGRDGYRYSEGERYLLVEVALLSGNPSFAIYTETIKKWLPPYDGETLSEDDKKRILEKICRYFDEIGVSYKTV